MGIKYVAYARHSVLIENIIEHVLFFWEGGL